MSKSDCRQCRKQIVVEQQHAFKGKSLASLSRDALATHCHRGNPKPKTFNNRRGILFTFFKYSFCQDWVVANPLEKVPHLRIAHQRGSAKSLSAEQAAKLMRHVEQIDGGALVPFFALALFAGIRPCVRTGEIYKLKPEHVRLDTGVILIEPEVSKVRMKRNVTIAPNLAAWLAAYPLAKFPIIPANLQHQRARIAEKFDLSHDIMRHTFISMHVAKYRSMGEAALQAGNSESIIRTHYLDLKTPAEAEQFFGILPTPVVAAHVAHIAPTASTNLAADPLQPYLIAAECVLPTPRRQPEGARRCLLIINERRGLKQRPDPVGITPLNSPPPKKKRLSMIPQLLKNGCRLLSESLALVLKRNCSYIVIYAQIMESTEYAGLEPLDQKRSRKY